MTLILSIQIWNLAILASLISHIAIIVILFLKCNVTCIWEKCQNWQKKAQIVIRSHNQLCFNLICKRPSIEKNCWNKWHIFYRAAQMNVTPNRRFDSKSLSGWAELPEGNLEPRNLRFCTWICVLTRWNPLLFWSLKEATGCRASLMRP